MCFSLCVELLKEEEDIGDRVFVCREYVISFSGKTKMQADGFKKERRNSHPKREKRCHISFFFFFFISIKIIRFFIFKRVLKIIKNINKLHKFKLNSQIILINFTDYFG